MEDFDINNLTQEKIKILQAERLTRIKNVFMYQINLDNYLLSIKEIEKNYSDDIKMRDFRQNLQNIVESTILEQTKEKIVLKVIETQLKELSDDNL
jgi:uncharacterized protein YPO0396